MIKNYNERKDINPWNKSNTFTLFWKKRFFRIAPLYYFLLAVSLFFNEELGQFREIISFAWSSSSTSLDRYTDSSLANIISHLTFTFGFIPHFSYRTPLPDWSIGLEMQFYLLFPFIMLFAYKFDLFKAISLSVLICIACRWAFPDFFRFPMPSFILIKLHLFLVGTALYMYIFTRQNNYLILILTLPFATLVINTETTFSRLVSQYILILIMYISLRKSTKNNGIVNKAITTFRSLLSTRLFQFFGDVSYSVYLLHLLIVIPVIGWLITNTNFSLLGGYERLVIVMAISFPIVYAISTALYKFIERPGISLGK